MQLAPHTTTVTVRHLSIVTPSLARSLSPFCKQSNRGHSRILAVVKSVPRIECAPFPAAQTFAAAPRHAARLTAPSLHTPHCTTLVATPVGPKRRVYARLRLCAPLDAARPDDAPPSAALRYAACVDLNRCARRVARAARLGYTWEKLICACTQGICHNDGVFGSSTGARSQPASHPVSSHAIRRRCVTADRGLKGPFRFVLM